MFLNQMFGRKPTFSHYTTMQLPKTASVSDVKKMYRQLARQHHPDKPGGNEQKFKEIQEAYDVLKDPVKRRQYDRIGDQMSASTPHDRPHHQQVALTLEEMYKGGETKINLKFPLSCLDCGGTGGGGSVCGQCKGAKVIQSARAIGPGMMQMVRNPCPECKGKGRMITKQCISCEGEGLMYTCAEKIVKYPKGVLPNDQLELEVQDQRIILHFIAKPHQKFQREMFELFTTKHISFAQALTGIDILVSHINGEHLRLNSTTPLSEKTYLVQNGGMPIDESYREKLRGLPLDKKYGDLHVQIIID